MKKALTKEQLDALNLDIHIALNANAGSGKTSVLVERYFRILESGLTNANDLTPDNIVAITFTKKAAAEMLSRVIAKFSESFSIEKLRESKQWTDLYFIDKLRLFRNKLTNARISTIHSFCLQIISNYPIEAGIPVNFREISESERLQLLEDAFNQTLMNWLEVPDLKKKLGDILSIIPFNDLKELSFKTISNIDLWNELNELYSKDFEAYLVVLQEFVEKTYRTCLNQVTSKFTYALDDYDRLNLSIEKANVLKKFFNESKRFEEDGYAKLLFDTNFWELLGNFINTIYTKELKPRKREISDEDIFESLQEISEKFYDILRFLLKIIEYHIWRSKVSQSFPELDIERKYFETSKTIFAFIKDVNSLFGKLKYDEGFVDFSDMLVKTRDLLTKFPEILAELRKEIKYLLVDEFQDTDQIQFEIVQQLVPTFAGDDVPIPNLFIVGDEKQSIYSFRNADVRVFKKAKEYISELNESDGGNVGLLKLTTTFRLRPEIAGFVDTIFSELMSFDESEPFSDFNIEYEPFVIPAEKVDHTVFEETNTIPPVTFLFEIKGEEATKKKKEKYKEQLGKVVESAIEDVGNFENLVQNDEDEKFSTLPILMAKHIKFLVNNPNAKVFDKENNDFRMVRYSDIAVLSRKTKDLAQIAAVFGNHGIPFIFFGSKNFFSTREIQDVISFLKFLVNPKDDVSLAGVLCSMFFGFTDEMLTNIATLTSEKNVTFWEKLLKYGEYLEEVGRESFTPEEYEIQYSRVKFAIEVIEKLRQQASILPINELIHRILVETEWHKKVRVFQNAEQMLANMDELLDYAREYINVGFRTILDFLDDIDYIARQGVPDVDRFGFVSSDAVTLLTFHSAKGLEFPVVYVHNIDYRTRGADKVEVSRELGLIFPVEIAIEGEVVRVSTLQNLFASQQLSMEQEAEELRILYVALTRASDFLIVTGRLYEPSKKGIGQDLICNPKDKLKDILEVLDLSFTFPETNYSSTLKTKINVGKYNENGEYEVETQEIQVPMQFIFDLYPEELVDNASKIDVVIEEERPVLLLLDKIESTISKSIFSSTKFNIFTNDPKNYVKSYFLGIHRSILDLMKANLQEDYEHRDDLILSSIVGNTIHICLEKINDWYTADGFLADKLYETIDAALYEQKRNLELDVQRKIVEQCSNIVQTQLFQRNKERILLAEKEFEMIFPFYDNYIVAKLDILLQNEDGEFEIWDWKSNNIKTIAEMQKVAESYRLQMETYAFALSQSFPMQKTFRAKLLFTKLAKPNANDMDWTYDFQWSNTDMLKIQDKLLQYAHQINNLEF